MGMHSSSQSEIYSRSPQSRYTNSRHPQEEDLAVSFEAGERKRVTGLAFG